MWLLIQLIQRETSRMMMIMIVGDFADFESHLNVTKSEETHQMMPIQDNVNQDKRADGDDDDDDDFGDFNTAEPNTITTITPSSIVTNASQIITIKTPVVSSNNLNERISKILHIMFKPHQNLAEDDSAPIQTDKIQDIPFTSIDAAKALEYQWLNSNTRHSFIKSLGMTPEIL
ncbi:hypothetical protein EVAR_71497_1 [Eumeta japonica]|uniref:Uncharacterized protein n=1 Tax=Eumeta variegata TaxID=151549 RepID=A0A4C2AD54_EUMVA|nr:hypothetical protein EVAR_71497_1 [Eumeta japonica]